MGLQRAKSRPTQAEVLQVASSDLADGGVNGWGGVACGGVVVSGGRCWWRAATGRDDEWIGMVRPVVEMSRRWESGRMTE
jgi:hypothetical protein